jgi:hypothetical protein
MSAVSKLVNLGVSAHFRRSIRMTSINPADQGRRGIILARGRERPDVPDSPLLERVQKWILHHEIEHLHGPKEVDYGADELVVLVVARDGRPYIKSFVEHYRSLGAKHLVFLDNGSVDGTVEALTEYEDVTVLRTKLYFEKYAISMRQYLIERFGRGRWTLTVDQDELFDYPYSDVVSLKALLRYLNDNSYTAVVAQWLDMFSEELLSKATGDEEESLKEVLRFYDLSNIRTQSYETVGDLGNVLANEEIKVLRDGMVHTLFGFRALLTKHPLIFLDDRIKPMDLSEHWVGNARVADFTGVLLHYKNPSHFYEVIQRKVTERHPDMYQRRWDAYFEALNKAPGVAVMPETARELKSVNDLVGTDFAVVSRQYMELVEREGRRKGLGEEATRHRILEAFFSARAEAHAQSQKAGELEQQRRELEQRLKALKQKLDLSERQTEQQQPRRIKELEEQLHDKTRRIEQLRRRLANETRKAESLQRQLASITASKRWRLLDGLNRARKRILQNR